MTARHQFRVGGRLARGGRSPIDAIPAPTVGQMLQAARQRKGVDLHRAERDTKIRAKHLVALEEGDWEELPGPVYARGFLRNYATYLGLEADGVLEDWRLEQEALARPRPPAPLAIPPQPITEPRGHLRFTRRVFAGSFLIVLAAVFVGYLGFNLLRFAHTPVITLDGGSVQTLTGDATTYTLSGSVDLPGAFVRVTGPSGYDQHMDADTNGRWQMVVPVTKGQNDFFVSARDPQLQDPDRGSTPIRVVITVPIPATPSPSPSPTLPESSAGASPGPGESALPTGLPPLTPAPITPSPVAQVLVSEPADGSRVTEGTVKVKGTSTAPSVQVFGQRLGNLGGGPQPSAQPTPPPTIPLELPPTTVVAPVSNGQFIAEVPMTSGRWRLSVIARGTPGVTTDTMIWLELDVKPAQGIVLAVNVLEHAAWIRVVADGVLVEPGRSFRRHETATFTATSWITVLTGNSGSTAFVQNGKDLGSLADVGAIENWQFTKGQPPKRV